MSVITIITYSVPQGDDWTIWALYVDDKLETWATQRHIEADVTIAEAVNKYAPVTGIRYLGWLESYGGINGNTPQEPWFAEHEDPPEELTEIPNEVISRATDYLAND